LVLRTHLNKAGNIWIIHNFAIAAIAPAELAHYPFARFDPPTGIRRISLGGTKGL